VQIINIQKVGENVINALRDSKGYYKLFCYFIKNLLVLKIAPIRSVLYKQIYFTGIEAINKVSIIGILIGIVIITQVTNIAGSDTILIGKILTWTVVRELGPLFVAIIVITRSGTAVTSELASMKINREIESLRIMGINPVDYLIVPRIMGITLSVFILAFYFQILAIAGGLVFSSILWRIPFMYYLKGIFSALSISEIAVSLLKSLVFGLLISMVSSYQGFSVKASITEIPQAGIRAVMQSLFMVFIFDGIITLITFL